MYDSTLLDCYLHTTALLLEKSWHEHSPAHAALRCYELTGTDSCSYSITIDTNNETNHTIKHLLVKKPPSSPWLAHTENIQPPKKTWRLEILSPMPPGTLRHLHLGIRLMIHRIQQWHHSGRTPIFWPDNGRISGKQTPLKTRMSRWKLGS